MALFVTSAITFVAAQWPHRDRQSPWHDAIPQLELGDALTLITALLVTYGLGVLGAPAALRHHEGDVDSAMADQHLREIAALTGWAGATIALWSIAGTVVANVEGAATAGSSIGGVGSALTAGALVAAMGALVRVKYAPGIQSLVDAERWANEIAIRQRLASWAVPNDPASPWRARLGLRLRALVLPVVAQTACASIVVGVVIAASSPHTVVDVGIFLVLGFAVASLAAAHCVMVLAFFHAIPRAPILGTVFAAALLLVGMVGVVFALLYREHPSILAAWFAPMVILAIRLVLGIVMRRRVPAVAPWPWALVDRRWWVAATLTASQPPRLVAVPDGQGGRGYM
ncbi:hypothetical protein J1G44_06200 [Cellulomonas sp. zg-ZUI199]|uniref:Uncharacterized protein n=1 Tax=Cellulomonas wangleii TaxID=2816956 RepID=A0ABX8D5I9_9CELL|nr:MULTISPECIES: hypothetical protein [Cellulomonas]MBO0898925.1 hypothetical protein [Cellulomonas sp. zg-ZUI22]MBO0923788.1 hypothetical protein [Cellulomonas wangleii]MBO0924070.1 hypothetical protein [Cellulomonas wangleii]QVI62095.1 hypothetical protein KG103_17045 [Cellulomonas wangleii]